MSTKNRERERRRAGDGVPPPEGDGARPRDVARRGACARVSRALALAFAVSALSACVVSPAGDANVNASRANATNGSPAAAATPSLEVSPFPAASATPQQGTTPAPAPPQSAATPAGPAAEVPGSLLIPVAGVRAEDLLDTFNQARSEGRVHNSIDIIAPRGTPVVAAADGLVVKLFQSVKGGITVYQLGVDGKTIYYYSHLDRYADGLAENKQVRRGEMIGYVGDTGNATPGNYHLHFSIWITEDPKRYWDGVNINPYPLLTGKK